MSYTVCAVDVLNSHLKSVLIMMGETLWVYTLRCIHLKLHIYIPRRALLPYRSRFLCFSLYIYFYICTRLDFWKQVISKQNVLFYAVVGSVSELDLLVRFVRQPKFCVFVALNSDFSGFSLLLTLNVMSWSLMVSFLWVLYLQDELVWIVLPQHLWVLPTF